MCESVGESVAFAKRLKALNGLTAFEFISEKWTTEPQRFKLHLNHLIAGLNTYVEDVCAEGDAAASGWMRVWFGGCFSSLL